MKPPSPPNYKYFEQGKGTSSKEDAAFILKHIDDSFKGLHETVHVLYQKNTMLEELLNNGSENSDLRITEVGDEQDTKPKYLGIKYDALSVTSFEVAFPRFLSDSGTHVVVGNDSSHYSHISSYKNWNDPSSGYKYRLKYELENFRRDHLSTIR